MTTAILTHTRADADEHVQAPARAAASTDRRALTWASWLLRLALLGHAAALFIIAFTGRQTHFGSALFVDWLDPRVGRMFFGFTVQDPAIAAMWIERVTVSIYLLAALVTLIRPMAMVLLLMSGYALLEALTGLWYGGYGFYGWTVYCDALRWGAPLVLLILGRTSGDGALATWRRSLATDLLRGLIAIVFAAHGLEALYGNPRFIDLILGTFRQLFEVRLTESTALTMMTIIGIADLVLAAAVVLLPLPVLTPPKLRIARRRGVSRRFVVPAIVLWMALWGLLTAMSRMTALGFPTGLYQYPELLIRTSHFLGPLALLALLRVTFPIADATSDAPMDAPSDALSDTPQEP